MQSSPSTLYSQSTDKQRIVVVGQSKSRITQLILHIVKQYERKFDYSTPAEERISEAAVLLFEPKNDSTMLAEYHHHILLISSLSSSEKETILRLANATPKSGTIIYCESDPIAKEIGKIERQDVFSHPYVMAKHKIQNGKIILISSTKEEFPIQLSSNDDLIDLSAAKELLKKIGISSSQFYKAIASFQ